MEMLISVVWSKKYGTNKINYATKTGYYNEILETIDGILLCLARKMKILHF